MARLPAFYRCNRHSRRTIALVCHHPHFFAFPLPSRRLPYAFLLSRGIDATRGEERASQTPRSVSWASPRIPIGYSCTYFSPNTREGSSPHRQQSQVPQRGRQPKHPAVYRPEAVALLLQGAATRCAYPVPRRGEQRHGQLSRGGGSRPGDHVVSEVIENSDVCALDTKRLWLLFPL